MKERFSRLGVPVHIWEKKEIESYFLQADLIARVSGRPVDEIEEFLLESANEHKATMASQLATHRMEAEKGPKLDKATILKEAHADFDIDWQEGDFQSVGHPRRMCSPASTVDFRRRVEGRQLSSASRCPDFRRDRPEMFQVLRQVSALFGDAAPVHRQLLRADRVGIYLVCCLPEGQQAFAAKSHLYSAAK